MDYYEIVKKLIGPIVPVGETHTDDKRYENLKSHMLLVEKLVEDLEYVAYLSSKPEHSVSRAGKKASELIDNLASGER